MQRVEKLVTLGASGKAARALVEESALPPIDDALVAKLRELHPAEPPSDRALPQHRPIPSIVVTRVMVRKAVKKSMARGAAPGLDGWTRELLVPLVENPSTLFELTALVGDMVSGDVSESFAWRTRATAGIAIGKPGGKVRPIEPESATAKLACVVAKSLIPQDYVRGLQPMQQGVGGNVEESARGIIDALPTGEVTLLLDCSNAYGSMYRRQILDEVYREPMLAAIHGVTSWLLAPAALIGFYEHGVLRASMPSTRGVRQGMALGPLWFAVGVHRRMLALQELHAQVVFTLYLDDITLRGPLAQVAAARKDIEDFLASIGLRVNAAKSVVYSSQESEAELEGLEGIPRCNGILRVLGAGLFVGGSQSLSKWLREIAEGHGKTMEELRTAAQSGELLHSSAVRILRGSVLPRMNFYIRTHAPAETDDATAWFDSEVQKTFTTIIEANVREGDIAQEIMRLPLRLGGFGIRSMNQTATIAFDSRVTGAQKKAQVTLDAERRAALVSRLTEQQVAWLHSSQIANMPLYHEECQLANKAFDTWSKQRLFLRVLPVGRKCPCGEDNTS
jgi:hypothetical protein